MKPQWIESFHGHVLAFTGRVFVDGNWEIREDCVRMAMARGAADWKTDMSRKVSLLVHGDLASQNVTDKTRQYSKKLKLADTLRRSGHELAIIDGQGFADLLDGYPARNRELRVAGVGEVLVLPSLGEGILGGPLAERAPTAHQPSSLTVDLEALDRATAAHEATLLAFARRLASRGLVPQRHGRNAPKFDVGWADGLTVYVAEVKSLGSAVEDQQIRLGIGQVVDYAEQLRSRPAIPGQSVRAVLVLERRPREPDRWMAAAESVGIGLTWGPDFVGWG